jgi:hypothetical protein
MQQEGKANMYNNQCENSKVPPRRRNTRKSGRDCTSSSYKEGNKIDSKAKKVKQRKTGENKLHRQNKDTAKEEEKKEHAVKRERDIQRDKRSRKTEGKVK